MTIATYDTSKAARATKDQAAFDAVKVGDVFVSSWGYDQTNIDFYEVVAKTKARIKVRPIASTVIESTRYSDEVVPAKGHYTGPAVVKAVRASSWRHDFDPTKDAYFSVNDYSTASKWTGGARHQTSYWAGH